MYVHVTGGMLVKTKRTYQPSNIGLNDMQKSFQMLSIGKALFRKTTVLRVST